MNEGLIGKAHEQMKTAEPELYALMEKAIEDAAKVRNLDGRKWGTVKGAWEK